MDRLFNMDNSFFRFMGRFADLVILNFFFIMFSLPVVTTGASLCAMYYVTLKMTENKECYIIKDFIKSFKLNLKQSLVIWSVMIVAGAPIIIGLYFLPNIQHNIRTLVFSILMLCAMIWLLIFLYIFPIISKFELSVLNMFRNALFMAIGYLPWTILLMIITIAPFVIAHLFPTAITYMVLLFVVCGFAVISLCVSYILSYLVFARHTREGSS